MATAAGMVWGAIGAAATLVALVLLGYRPYRRMREATAELRAARHECARTNLLAAEGVHATHQLLAKLEGARLDALERVLLEAAPMRSAGPLRREH